MSGTSHEGDVLSQLTVPLLAYDQWWNDRHASLQRRGWKAPNDSSCTIHVAACTLLTSSTASWLACIYMWRAVSLRASIIFTCMRIYVTHVRLWFTPFYCTSTSVGHEKFIMHARLFSIPCIHSRFLQGLLPPHAINLLHSCDTVRPGPMQCRNHAALAAFCFLYACWHGAVRDGCRVSVTFPSRLCQGKLSVCVHDAHVQVYPVFHGWVLFFSFLLLHLCRSKLHTYGFFTRLR